MLIVESYATAVALCVVTMLCWGSWANTQKLTGRAWPFQLFYWDYAIGVLLFTLGLAFTAGSTGTAGRSFLWDLQQASLGSLGSAFLGGVVFNLANILLVAAIDIAGMAVAFPIGIGLALVLGVVINYLAVPVGSPLLLFLGVAGVVLAIMVDAIIYRKLPSQAQRTTGKGLAVSLLAGVLMGFFYRFVAASMSPDFVNLQSGKLGPYTALVLFSTGLFVSNLVWNSLVMIRPLVGEPVPYRDYIAKGSVRLHLIGILGGAVWGMGMSLSIIASGAAGFAISYGLGQGATMIAALWGVFIWKEFEEAQGAVGLISLMFASFIVGLSLIVYARIG
ncbi:MAG: multidrug DMT transporter permease [Acidobacteriota bacterium]